MKTRSNKLSTKKIKSNPFDTALLRLGQHVVPQQGAQVLLVPRPL